MPLTIERYVAEQLAMNRELSAGWACVNADVDIQGLFSFHGADKKNTCGLYEAASAEAIREAARRLNAPADRIVGMGQLRPSNHPLCRWSMACPTLLYRC